MQQTTLSLSGPADLLAVLPYHFGFHPSRSVVVVSLHDRRLGLVVRLDAVADPAAAADAAASLVDPLRRERPSGVMVVGFEDRMGQTARLSQAVTTRLQAEGITVVDRIVVRAGRWTGLMCDCCPDQPVPAAHEVGAVATYVGLGRVALGSRDELAAILRPTEPASPGLARAVDDWVAKVVEGGGLFTSAARPAPGGGHPTWAEACVSTWAELLVGRFDGEQVPTERLTLLLGSLRHRGLRDGVIAMLCPESLPTGALDPRLAGLFERHLVPVVGDDGVDHGWADSGPPEVESAFGGPGRQGLAELSRQALTRARLERLCRLAPESHAAPVLAVTAACAWFSGDGAAARVAVERALEVEPGHVLARLLEHLLDLGVRPPSVAA
ncbi:DUF4192 domain-containing protein [Intrasporangium sp.]|uniref:DUF4192 domain-containing protein n=1 Tax=Intrasporangium sp. TaxID=1925024 RepID=UPI00322212F0